MYLRKNLRALKKYVYVKKLRGTEFIHALTQKLERQSAKYGAKIILQKLVKLTESSSSFK